MISAGQLNQKIKLLHPKLNSSGIVIPSEEGEVYKEVWANIRPITAREQMRNQLEVQSLNFTVLIRYTSGITQQDYVIYKGLRYLIYSIELGPNEDYIILAISYDSQYMRNKVMTS